VLRYIEPPHASLGSQRVLPDAGDVLLEPESVRIRGWSDATRPLTDAATRPPSPPPLAVVVGLTLILAVSGILSVQVWDANGVAYDSRSITVSPSAPRCFF